LSREGERIEAPQADLPLQVGDAVMVLGTPGGLADLTSTVHNSADVEYLATGVRVPRTLVFRALRRLRRGGPGASGPDSPGPGGAPAGQADGEQPRP
ncbi:TrkA C-terminal domain-containing protein, partial [Streptococcus pneumoniae]|nr:TrkA C-terminal domain-containing protein [Streptococcus pneumoniae]